MTDKDRLMHALFGHAERREHINIKFFRGTSDDVTGEQLSHEAVSGIEQILTGLAEPLNPSATLDAGYRERELSEILDSL